MSPLEKNLEIARDLCVEAARYYRFPPSNLRKFRGERTEFRQCRSDAFEMERRGLRTAAQTDDVLGECKELRTDSEEATEESRGGFAREFGRFNWQNDEMISTMVEKAHRAGCGNCGELAGKVYLLMADYPQSASIMSVDIQTKVLNESDDHQFVIIGGSGEERAERTTSFSANAVVCDPWAYHFTGKKIDSGAYPASKLTTKLNLIVQSWRWSTVSVKAHRSAGTRSAASQRSVARRAASKKAQRESLLECANRSRQGVCLR